MLADLRTQLDKGVTPKPGYVHYTVRQAAERLQVAQHAGDPVERKRHIGFVRAAQAPGLGRDRRFAARDGRVRQVHRRRRIARPLVIHDNALEAERQRQRAARLGDV